MSVCDRLASIMRRAWPTGGCGAVGALKNRGFLKTKSVDWYIHLGNVEINTNRRFVEIHTTRRFVEINTNRRFVEINTNRRFVEINANRRFVEIKLIDGLLK